MFSFFWLLLLWIREAFVGFFRNLGWNVAALFLTVFCLLGFSISFVAGENAKFFAQELGEKVEIQLDLLETIEEGQHSAIIDRIHTIPEVKEITYISKEETYEKVQNDMGEDADILEVLDKNPFSARIVVKLHAPDQVEKIAAEMDAWGVASNIQYGEGYVEKLLSITDSVSKIGYFVTAIVALATVYIVSSVIKFNIDQRKQEIKVKQLTGTGIFTIRIPFMLEALLITGLSSLAVYSAFYFGYDFVVAEISHMAPYIPMIESSYIVNGVSKWLFILAFGIGIVGSLLSTSRNLEKI